MTYYDVVAQSAYYAYSRNVRPRPNYMFKQLNNSINRISAEYVYIRVFLSAVFCEGQSWVCNIFLATGLTSPAQIAHIPAHLRIVSSSSPPIPAKKSSNLHSIRDGTDIVHIND